MEAGREVFLFIWRGPLGSPVLYGSLLVHASLAFVSLYQRRDFRLARWERVQFGLGFLIPPLLFFHAVGTHLAHDWFDTLDSYTLVVLNYWVLAPVQCVHAGRLPGQWCSGADCSRSATEIYQRS